MAKKPKTTNIDKNATPIAAAAPTPGEIVAAPPRRGLRFGAVAVGATAFAALAIGTLAIGRLAIGRARLGRVEIDELIVRKLTLKPPPRDE